MKKDNVNQERKHVSMINEYDLTYSKEKVQTLAQMQTERDDEAKKMARFNKKYGQNSPTSTSVSL